MSSCPPSTNAFKAMDPDAPVLREDIKDKTEGATARASITIMSSTWEVGDEAGPKVQSPARKWWSRN